MRPVNFKNTLHMSLSHLRGDLDTLNYLKKIVF